MLGGAQSLEDRCNVLKVSQEPSDCSGRGVRLIGRRIQQYCFLYLWPSKLAVNCRQKYLIELLTLSYSRNFISSVASQPLTSRTGVDKD